MFQILCSLSQDKVLYKMIIMCISYIGNQKIKKDSRTPTVESKLSRRSVRVSSGELLNNKFITFIGITDCTRELSHDTDSYLGIRWVEPPFAFPLRVPCRCFILITAITDGQIFCCFVTYVVFPSLFSLFVTEI